MENLIGYKNKLIGIRNEILESLKKSENKEEMRNFLIKLHNVNERIKNVEIKIQEEQRESQRSGSTHFGFFK
mgnify:FL=1